jgi:hypothetical protein
MLGSLLFLAAHSSTHWPTQFLKWCWTRWGEVRAAKQLCNWSGINSFLNLFFSPESKHDVGNWWWPDQWLLPQTMRGRQTDSEAFLQENDSNLFCFSGAYCVQFKGRSMLALMPVGAIYKTATFPWRLRFSSTCYFKLGRDLEVILLIWATEFWGLRLCNNSFLTDRNTRLVVWMDRSFSELHKNQITISGSSKPTNR